MSHLKMLGQKKHAIHTAPLIRREEYYSNDLREDRIKLFSSLFNCARKMPIQAGEPSTTRQGWFCFVENEILPCRDNAD